MVEKYILSIFIFLYAYCFNYTLKEKWEDLKKNISINPQGNRVRFVPIVPNNVNRLNTLPSTSSRGLLFKPFIPKHITSCASKENMSLVQYKNDNENKNIMSVTPVENLLHSAKFNTKNFIPQHFQKKEVNLNTSTSLVEKCNMNLLENSLPKFPLRTIWTNANNSKDFECSSSFKNKAFRKPCLSNLNCSSQTVQNTNYVLKSKFQNTISDPLNTVNVSQYFKSPFLISKFTDHKLHPIPENMSTSFFSTDIDNLTLATGGQNLNTLEKNSLSSSNQTLNLDNIWKNYQYQSPKI